MSDREEFWHDYYNKVATEGRPWLDFSNERVQSQHFALALEAAGAIQGRRCLDIGCGWGQVSESFHSLRAAEVTGIDLVAELIEANKTRAPAIRWLCGSLSDPALESQLGTYDIVFLIEVLQYLPLRETLAQLWNRMAPGGRLVGIIPNADCPIVKRTMERFDDKYHAPTIAELSNALQSLDQVEVSLIRGAAFGADQRLTPYVVTAWGAAQADGTPPNRLNFVAVKQGETDFGQKTN